MTTEYPLKLKSALREAIWGGDRLFSLYKKGEPGRAVGESWEISAREEAPSTVMNGPLTGSPLNEAQRLWGVRLSGYADFKLLIKLICSQEKLSLQVHPGGASGKTEAWYVLWAQKGAKVIYGMNRSADRATLLRGANGDEAALHSAVSFTAVKAGDVVFIPAGTLHALMGGIAVYEVQQNSDITYRLHDWGRRGADGKPRELHIEKALSCVTFEPPPKLPWGAVLARGPVKRKLMAACPMFALELINLTAPSFLAASGIMKCYTCLHGAGVVEGEHGFVFRGGDSFIIPAGMDGAFMRGDAYLACAYVPDMDALKKEFRLRGPGLGRVAGMK